MGFLFIPRGSKPIDPLGLCDPTCACKPASQSGCQTALLTRKTHVMGAVGTVVPRSREMLSQSKMGCYPVDVWASTPVASQAKGRATGKTVRCSKHLGLAGVQRV